MPWLEFIHWVNHLGRLEILPKCQNGCFQDLKVDFACRQAGKNKAKISQMKGDRVKSESLFLSLRWRNYLVLRIQKLFSLRNDDCIQCDQIGLL